MKQKLCYKEIGKIAQSTTQTIGNAKIQTVFLFPGLNYPFFSLVIMDHDLLPKLLFFHFSFHLFLKGHRPLRTQYVSEYIFHYQSGKAAYVSYRVLVCLYIPG